MSNKKRQIRSAIHQIELTMKSDRSKIAERERDLLTQCCVSLYDKGYTRVVRQLRRLTASQERGKQWLQVLAMVNT